MNISTTVHLMSQQNVSKTILLQKCRLDICGRPWSPLRRGCLVVFCRQKATVAFDKDYYKKLCKHANKIYKKERNLSWSTVALLFLAWQMMSKNTQSSPKLQDIVPFLNDDTRGILDGVAKLSSPTATSEDKTGAIFQMMTNPTIMSFAQNLFGGGEQTSTDPPQNGATDTATQAQFTPPQEPQDTGTFATTQQQQTNVQPSCAPSEPSRPMEQPQNDEGYTFASPTERAKQFFAPIDPIATTEIKHKLCYFYDHWYLTK